MHRLPNLGTLTALAATAMLVTTPMAHALPQLNTAILGGTLQVATTGVVRAEFLDSDADYSNQLFLVRDHGPDHLLFTTKTKPGKTVSLGHFIEGAELVFRLHVLNTGHDFYTGAATGNRDGEAHALAITRYDLDQALYYTDVGFEDLWDGGDQDYNDFVFRLWNVIDPPSQPSAPTVPEPGMLALLGAGLVAFGARRRRRR